MENKYMGRLLKDGQPQQYSIKVFRLVGYISQSLYTKT